jgi:hypothetical protein
LQTDPSLLAAAAPRARAAACALILLLAMPAAAAARAGVLLDLPYLAQTEQLCGGASAAMILRYWGETAAAPQDFSGFVERTRGGIRTTVLTAALVDRGWRVERLPVLTTPGAAVRVELDAGRPVLSLIEDRPGAFHYVVVVGYTADAVVFHDPARAPFRVMPSAEFDRRSNAADGWMARVQPANATAPPQVSRGPEQAALTASQSETACSPMVDASVRAATTGDLPAAERGLLDALTRCPEDADAWRELGGLRFVQKRYTDAYLLVEKAATLRPSDRDAWQLLGSSQYLRENLAGALEAWNRIDAPRILDVSFSGLQRTRHPAAIGALGLTAGDVLTPRSFHLAARRLAELPTAAATGLRFQPVADSRVSVEATAIERPLIPQGWPAWLALATTSAFRREVQLDVSSPAGAGDLWTIAHRWARERPRSRFALQVPPVPHLPLFVGLDLLDERQAYQLPTPDNGEPFRESRRRAQVTLSNWAAPWLRWEASSSVDRIGGSRYAAFGGRIVTRAMNDRAAVTIDAARWIGRGDARGFGTGTAIVWWRSSARAGIPVLSARAGESMASAQAPLATWAAAGASDGRGVFLRGHSLFDDGIITTPVLGRSLAFGNVEYTHPVYTSLYGTLALAGFVDMARAANRLPDARDGRAHVDIGGGLRIGSPAFGGSVRLDLAYGLRDGAHKFSAGYLLPWAR